MKQARWGIVTFPGSNCDQDLWDAIETIGLASPVKLWHKSHQMEEVDLVILPGGFSYGDYLRSGAIARFSPIMNQVIKHAQAGKPVLGICNGFQILTEAGLLPGALRHNPSMQFICEKVHLRVEHNQSMATCAYQTHEVIQLPIAHGEGNYMASKEVLEELEANRQILFRYCSPNGDLEEAWTPNGSMMHIAGISNKQGNVIGMMPHPERAVDEKLGFAFGKRLFESLAGLCTA